MKTQTDRKRQLAEDYAKGKLPEQRGGSQPLTRWCPDCRTPLGGARSFRTGIAKTTNCRRCNGTGRLEAI